MSRKVVIWSGGLDSTLCLYLAGLTSTRSDPVVTFSIRSHYLINRYQMGRQTIARNRYLKWARGLGHFIKPVYLDISGTIIPATFSTNFESSSEFTEIRQRDMFSTVFAPYFKDGDVVIWGWKNNEVPDSAFFKRMRELSLNWQSYRAEVEHICPLKNLSDNDVSNIIRGAKIPHDCIYCCHEAYRSDKKCKCCKCLRFLEVYPELGI